VKSGKGNRYWFGDLKPRLLDCRVVREGLVMVRVGGGWEVRGSIFVEDYVLCVNYYHLEAE
jgi:hypothetical protein